MSAQFAHIKLLQDRWNADPANAAELRQLLEHPTLRNALEILTESGVPIESAPPVGATYTEWCASQRARSEGFFLFRANLQALAQPAHRPEILRGNTPWGHIKPVTDTLTPTE